MNKHLEKYHVLAETMVDAIFVVDSSGVFTYVSPKIESLLGYSADQLMGRSFEEVVTPECKQPVREHMVEIPPIQVPQLLTSDMLHVDGTRVTVESSVISQLDQQGEVVGKLGVMRDITQRKQAELELRGLRNYLSNIIDSMPSVLVGVDSDGRVTQWNKTVEQVTGITADSAHGKDLPELLPWMAAEMDSIAESIRTRRIVQKQKRPSLSNNDTRYEDVIIYPLIANGVEGAVIRIDDVTEKVRLEEMMVQSEKMLSVGGLAAGMAHEINNPLAGMMQTAEVLSDRLGLNQPIAANQKAAEAAGTSMQAIQRFMELRSIPRMLGTISDSGKRVAEIVHNMLSFARKSDASVSSHELNQLLDKTLELAATDYDLKKQYDFKRIEIRKEYADPLPWVPCEGTKIQQVLLNILRNGAQAMQGAGVGLPRLTLRTRYEKAHGWVCLEIEDNGPGMDEETRKRVFEPFFTTKSFGTGLGLSVAYFIITENHRGQMAVQTRPGHGATFILRLPIGSA